MPSGVDKKPQRLAETKAKQMKLPEMGQTFLWCSEVKGFGVRATPGGKTYVVQLRHEGRSMRLSLGPVGVLPCEGPQDEPGARDMAIAVLAAARRGEDPRAALGRRKAPAGITLNGVWAAYETAGYPMLRGVGRKRDSTVARDKKRWNGLIASDIGKEAVTAVDTARVQRWLDTIPTEGQRSHGLVLLKSILTFAESRKLAEVKRIDIKATKSREVQNFYRPVELAQLDRSAVDLSAERPSLILSMSALRLLIATGARLSEILGITWDSVDAAHGVIALERSKTSVNRRDILLTPVAVGIIKALPRTTSPYLFPSDSKTGHMGSLQKAWQLVVKRAGLRRLRLHDLRHSFASAGIAQGLSLYQVGSLLGHKQATTTQRYSHLTHADARASLAKIAVAISGSDDAGPEPQK